MFKGIVESESLNDNKILNELRIIKKHREHHPEATTKYWTVFRVEIPDDEIKLVTERISKVIKDAWYAIFWTEKTVFVVFSNKVFKIPREKKWKSDKYEEVKNYGIKHGVQEKYMVFQIQD